MNYHNIYSEQVIVTFYNENNKFIINGLSYLDSLSLVKDFKENYKS